MKKILMPLEKRDCPYCQEKNGLSYYQEDNFAGDRYYCEKCFGIVLFDGKEIIKMTSKAYPDRNKN